MAREKINVFILSALLSLTACSTSGPRSSLHPADQLLATTNDPQVELLQTANSDLMRLHCVNGLECPTIFMASIKTCPYSADQPKIGGQARQLLVGSDNLRIIEQRKVDQEGNLIQMTATADFDGTPVTMVNFTRKHAGCLQDISFFSASQESTEWWQNAALLKHLIDLVVRGAADA